MFHGILNFLHNTFANQPQQRATRPAAPMAMTTQSMASNAAPQFVPPPDQYRAGGAAVRQAANAYQYTPAFRNIVWGGQPFVANSQGLDSGGSLVGHAQAAGEFWPGQQFNSIHLSKATPASQSNTLTHEGLHRVWDTMPQTHQQFTNAYDKGITPDLRQYLQSRIAGYAAAQPLMDEGGVFSNDLSHLESLPSSIQNEIHSFIPEYYASQSPLVQGNLRFAAAVQNHGTPPPSPEPVNLQKYYQQYFNSQSVAQKTKMAAQLKTVFPSIFKQPVARIGGKH